MTVAGSAALAALLVAASTGCDALAENPAGWTIRAFALCEHFDDR
jgi:hypothetical protein